MLAQKSHVDQTAVDAQPAIPSTAAGLWWLWDFLVLPQACISERHNSK